MDDLKIKKVSLEEGITAEINNGELTLSKGGRAVKKKFSIKNIEIKTDGNSLDIVPSRARKEIHAIVNAVASEIKNMQTGLTNGYEYKMEIVYSHFPMNISVKGKIVEINNLSGGKNPKHAEIVGGDTKVDIKGKDVLVTGSDKEAVGQTCGNLEKATKIFGKDVRIFQDGIYIVKKGIKEGAK